MVAAAWSSTLASSQAFAAPPKERAPAAPPPADVDTAESLYAKLDYEAANSVAERVLKQKSLTHDQLVRATRILAVTHAILDKEEQARDAFVQLLVYDPEYSVDPNLGPKVTTPFMEARGVFRSLPSKPGVDVSANVREGGGTLKVTTRDPTRVVKKVVVGYRWTSSGDYTVTQLGTGEAVVEVSAAPAGRTRLDYYAQAEDDRDVSVFEAGNPTVPKSAFVEAGSGRGGGGSAEGSHPFVGSGVFWVLAGVVVAGAGTAAYFTFRPDDPPTSASLSPVIFCGGDRCR